jgi:hypothetical protein
MTHFGMFAKGGIHFSNPKEVIWRYDLGWQNLEGNTIVKSMFKFHLVKSC